MTGALTLAVAMAYGGGGRATVVRSLGVTSAAARRLLDEHRRRA